MSVKKMRLKLLRDSGFDRSYYDNVSHGWFVRCSQCEALVINNVPTHERGCPNTPKDTKEGR